MQLRDYQNQQVDDLRGGFRLGKTRQLLVSPTGSGKTMVFSFMTSEASKKGLRVMILAHRAEILDQIDLSLKRFGIVPGHIRSGLPMDRSAKVFVASVQTLVKRFDVVPVPDLIIVDEAHHSAASQFVKVFAQYPKAKFVGVTATPERLDGKGLGEFYGNMVLGPEVQWLIDRGFLKRPIYYGPTQAVDLSLLKKVAGDFAKDDLAEAMNKNSITGDAVNHYRKFGQNMPAVVFCVNLKHAADVAAQFCGAGIRAEIIDGSMTSDGRRARKDRLESGATQIMVSCELVSEGFDLPAVGVAILLRPTASLALHLQQIGRSLRPCPGQTCAVILDHAGNLLRHGPAEEKREWSLEGQSKKKRKPEQVLDTRQCDKCFAIYQGTMCPQCGATRESKARELEVKEGELQQMRVDEIQARRDARREEGACSSYQDFIALGKRRGYKPGWAYNRWKTSRHYTPFVNKEASLV